MPKAQWVGALAAVILGLGLILQPNLISSLPQMLHYILGFALVGIGGYAAYSYVK